MEPEKNSIEITPEMVERASIWLLEFAPERCSTETYAREMLQELLQKSGKDSVEITPEMIEAGEEYLSVQLFAYTEISQGFLRDLAEGVLVAANAKSDAEIS